MKPEGRGTLPLIAAVAACLLGALGTGAFLAKSFAAKKVLERARERLGIAAEEAQRALSRQQKAMAGALETATRLPTLKAAATLQDPLTLSENLIESLPGLVGETHVWVGNVAGVSRIVAVLDPSVPGGQVLLDPRRTADPREAALDFDTAPATSENPFPASLPVSGWAVGSLDESFLAEPMLRALVEVGDSSITRLETGVSGAPPTLIRHFRGRSWLAVSRASEYKDRELLGVYSSLLPLTDLAAGEVSRSTGVVVHVLEDQPAAKEAPVLGMFRGLPPTEEASVRRMETASGAFAALEVSLGPRASASLLLLEPLDAGWTSLSLRDLSKPLFALAVFLVVLALLAVPLGAYLWISRPAPTLITQVGTLTSAGTVAAIEGSGGQFGRSAVAQVLDLFPEDRFGKPKALGRGGMGMVLKLEDQRLGRSIALKIMTMGDADPEIMKDLRRRFLREARTMAALSHPGLPGIHDVHEEPVPYFVMEYIEGDSLQGVFEEDGIQPAEQVKQWLSLAADAVAHAHEQGIIHRDIKPDNLMLQPDGQIRVIDFGIALDEDTTRVTKAGFFVGTMAYIPPEQLAHLEIDERADIYSLAATGYYLLSGKYPYTTPQLAVGKGHNPAELPEAVPSSLAEVLYAALAMDRQYRPRDMAAFRAQLAGEQSPTLPPKNPQIASPEIDVLQPDIDLTSAGAPPPRLSQPGLRDDIAPGSLEVGTDQAVLPEDAPAEAEDVTARQPPEKAGDTPS